MRAARAGEGDNVRPGKRHHEEPSVIDPNSDQEVYGVLLSERRRRGENVPRPPDSKVKPTQTKEPKRVPPTGIAKSRKKS
jgi:hypothetical protein